jgi:4-amino-4-deoxy-L-arabinose transferase-like glycosyltransferase
MRRHAFFLVLLSVAAVSRFVLLFTSQTHVHSDEAIIGLMGKHIAEGLYFPFYMYGQNYNAGAAWEAYLAAFSYRLFGFGAVPLKACIVLVSLGCLVLFYVAACRFYGRQTAAFASLAFALSPSLLKWHFQVRGYSWYFLSLPLLLLLFWSVDERPSPKGGGTFLFGLASGIFVWSLELVLAPVGALWLLLAVRRKLSLSDAAMGVLGFAVGYLPAVAFNLSHSLSNWREVFFTKTGGGSSFFSAATAWEILSQEMPKFFGPDTVLWYFPEKPISGFVFYAIAAAAVVLAAFPFVKNPSKLMQAIRGGTTDEDKDLLLLILTLAAFVPYVVAPFRVPGYFLAGCVFLSLLTGRLLWRTFSAPRLPIRVLGGGILTAMVLVGGLVCFEVGRRDQIETLTLDQAGNLQMSRVPGTDLDAVEGRLRQDEISSVWTTASFVYPFLFDSGEKLAVSAAIFGMDRNVYPPGVPRARPRPDQRTAFVMESDAPVRTSIEGGFAKARGARPFIQQYGTLTVIEASPSRR